MYVHVHVHLHVHVCHLDADHRQVEREPYYHILHHACAHAQTHICIYAYAYAYAYARCVPRRRPRAGRARGRGSRAGRCGRRIPRPPGALPRQTCPRTARPPSPAVVSNSDKFHACACACARAWAWAWAHAHVTCACTCYMCIVCTFPHDMYVHVCTCMHACSVASWSLVTSSSEWIQYAMKAEMPNMKRRVITW
jgi:hypothetical protein